MLEDKGTPDTSISQNGGRSCAFSPSPRDGCLLKKGSGIFQPSVPCKISVTAGRLWWFLKSGTAAMEQILYLSAQGIKNWLF